MALHIREMTQLRQRLADQAVMRTLVPLVEQVKAQAQRADKLPAHELPAGLELIYQIDTGQFTFQVYLRPPKPSDFISLFVEMLDLKVSDFEQAGSTYQDEQEVTWVKYLPRRDVEFYLVSRRTI